MFFGRALAHLPVLALAALAVTACGSDASSTTAGDSSGPSASGPTAPPGTPDCSSVWKGGATLPKGYSGCVDGSTYVPKDALACESGQRIIRYADRYYGVAGGTIHATSTALDHDRQYLAALRSCRA